jgi:anaerobic selenocysteine-containing dehydrogenase
MLVKEEKEMEKLTLTRRTFLKASAATAAAATLFSPETSPLKGLVEAKTPPAQGQVEKVRTVCRGCGKMECGVWVTVKDGRVIKIEGDDGCLTSEGNCCTKSMASIQALYHPDRVNYPMKRTKPKGEDPGWVRISWDEAIQTTAQKFQEAIEKYGAESIVGFGGTSRITTYAGIGLLQALGSPNGYAHGAYQVCKGPRQVSAQLTSFPRSSWVALVDGVKVFVQWGAATEISNYDDSGRVTVDRRFKAEKHIVVAPRLQNLGAQADIWLPLRPGTDTAMALAWIDVIIQEGLYDKDFVQKWTNGPFLHCPDIEPTGFTWLQPAVAEPPTIPLEIKTRLLKESDVVEGGSVKKFAVWDELSGGVKYFDADSGEWEVTPPGIEPALFGSYTVTLKDGRQVPVTPVFQLLADRAAEYSPEKAAVITEVPADKIREAARVYASQPGNGGIHYMLGTEHSANCIQNNRILNILVSITGNLDTPGGNRGATTDPLNPYNAALGAPPLSLEQSLKLLGTEKYPLLPWFIFPKPGDATAVLDAMHTGKPYPIGTMFNAEAGDFMNMSNSAYAWEGLKKVPFFCCPELWFTPLAEMADIVLPAAHWLETPLARISQGSSGGLGAQVGVIAPQFERRQDYRMAIEIAKAMGIPWWPPGMKTQWPTVEELLDFQVAPLGLTWQQFVDKFQQDGWFDMKKLRPNEWGTYRRYETGALRSDGKPGLPLPTMKVEIWSTVLESYHPGQNLEIPRHIEPPESPLARPDLVEEYPLTLITGRRIPVYFHNEHRQLPWCRENWPVPLLEINPETAAKLDIQQGDWVWIESPRGKIRQTADLYAGIDPRVVNAEHLWWYPEAAAPEHGCQYSDANRLVDRYSQDVIYGSTCLRGYPCRVYKAEEGAPPGIITSANDPRLKEWLPKPEGEV